MKLVLFPSVNCKAIKKSAQAGLADFSISSDQSNFDHQVGYTGFEPVTSTLSR